MSSSERITVKRLIAEAVYSYDSVHPECHKKGHKPGEPYPNPDWKEEYAIYDEGYNGFSTPMWPVEEGGFMAPPQRYLAKCTVCDDVCWGGNKVAPSPQGVRP